MTKKMCVRCGVEVPPKDQRRDAVCHLCLHCKQQCEEAKELEYNRMKEFYGDSPWD